MRLVRVALTTITAAAMTIGIGAHLDAQMGAGHTSGGQMGGSQTGGHQHGAMQGATAGMSSDQMMRNIDSMMLSVTTMMKDFTSMQAGSFGPQHDQMMSSIQGLVGQMHQVHAVMGEVAKAPSMSGNTAAMKSFQQAGTEFQKMGASAQAMMKSLRQAAKDMPNGHK